MVYRRILAISVILLGAGAAALGLEAWFSIGKASPFGHTQYGHAVGWAGLGTILLVFIYSHRKRHSPIRQWPRGWFRVHMAAGLLGPLLIFLHSGAHYHAIVPILAMMAMVVVMGSGIVGQAIHAYVLRRLKDERRRLQQEQLPETDIDQRLHGMASQEETFRIWQAVHAPMTLMFLVLTTLHIIAALFFGGFP